VNMTCTVMLGGLKLTNAIHLHQAFNTLRQCDYKLAKRSHV